VNLEKHNKGEIRMKLKRTKRFVLIIQAFVLMGLIISLNTFAAAEEPWVTSWGGSEYEQGTGVAIDSDGNIYCVGSTSSFAGGVNNIVLLKYTSNGTRLWVQIWGGTGSDTGSDVVVDNSGSIYCVGTTNSFALGLTDLVVIKYHPNGTQAWNSTWGTTYSESGSSIAIGPNGSVFCAGSASVTNADMVVVKFNSTTGEYMDDTSWGTSNAEIASEIAVASDGTIYCAGYGFIDVVKSYDMVLVKFFPNMTKAWSYSWGGTASDYTNGIAVDPSYVYCSGETWVGSRRMVALAKFQRSDGAEVWNTTWGTVDEHESASGLVVNSTEHIFCTGYVSSILTLFLFNPDGSLARTTSWGTSAGDFGYDLARGQDGCFYCVGVTKSIGEGNEDLVLVKFLSDGTAPKSPGGGGIPGFLLIWTILPVMALVLLALSKKINAKVEFPF
jgi:uncharacterized delta-60 repeat protein